MSRDPLSETDRLVAAIEEASGVIATAIDAQAELWERVFGGTERSWEQVSSLAATRLVQTDRTLMIWREPNGSLSAGLAAPAEPGAAPELFAQANSEGTNSLGELLGRLIFTVAAGRYHLGGDELPF